nr:hypothetical protein [Heyndrickxia oleronia]
MEIILTSIDFVYTELLFNGETTVYKPKGVKVDYKICSTNSGELIGQVNLLENIGDKTIKELIEDIKKHAIKAIMGDE